ncbi:MAG: hypothetical protein JO287_05380 [Pseudonocardiales bacterium]|nr:hypothetical protein [Pseudonocardiales bacterium]
MQKKKILTRLAPAAVVAVTAATVSWGSGVASAVPLAGSLGSLTIIPAEGTDIERMSATTSGPCTNATKLADLVIEGPVGADGTAPDSATFPTSNPYPVTSVDPNQLSTVAPFGQQFNKTIKDAAAERGKTIQVGEYHLTTRCFDEFAIEVLGTFTGGLIFDTPTHYTVIGSATTPTPTPGASPTPVPATPIPTPGASPTPVPATPTPTLQPGVTHTTTVLRAFPSPAFQGFPVILFAQVSPRDASGSVQFKDGPTHIGGPVMVFNGFALGFASGLNEGAHELTVEFAPTNPQAYEPSFDSKPLTVRSPFRWLLMFRR